MFSRTDARRRLGLDGICFGFWQHAGCFVCCASSTELASASSGDRPKLLLISTWDVWLCGLLSLPAKRKPISSRPALSRKPSTNLQIRTMTNDSNHGAWQIHVWQHVLQRSGFRRFLLRTGLVSAPPVCESAAMSRLLDDMFSSPLPSGAARPP